MKIQLGCIVDDFTGGADLANALVSAGLRTVQLLGVPPAGFQVPEVDSVIIAVKSRSNAAVEAVDMSLVSLAWLRAAGTTRWARP